MTTLRLHFDIRTWDDFHRELWARRLDGLAAPPGVQVTTNPAEADVILDLCTSHGLQSGHALANRPAGYHSIWPDKTLEWDSSDSPSGRLPGLYCSLPRRLFDPTRHRGFCYPWRFNNTVAEQPPAAATHLFGFTGSLSSPLRHRLLAALGSDPAGIVRRSENLWNRIMGDQPDPAKADYARDLGRVKFVLCPRGNGASSIRLFEAMESGRVPVIISDSLILPQCVSWDRCSIRIAERDLRHVPAILAERAADWPALAREARRQWEACFSNERLLSTLATECRLLLAQRATRPARWRVLGRILPAWALFRAKALRRRLQNLRPKSR